MVNLERIAYDNVDPKGVVDQWLTWKGSMKTLSEDYLLTMSLILWQSMLNLERIL